MKEYSIKVLLTLSVVIMTAAYLRTLYLVKQPTEQPSPLVEKIVKNIDENYFSDWKKYSEGNCYNCPLLYSNKKCNIDICVTNIPSVIPDVPIEDVAGYGCAILSPIYIPFNVYESKLIITALNKKVNLINYFKDKKRKMIDYYIHQAKEKQALAKICQ